MADPSTFTEDDGRELAVAMLRELDGRTAECTIDPAGHPPQLNAVQATLDAIRRRESRALEVGFTEGLTHYLAQAVHASGATAPGFSASMTGRVRKDPGTAFVRQHGR